MTACYFKCVDHKCLNDVEPLIQVFHFNLLENYLFMPLDVYSVVRSFIVWLYSFIGSIKLFIYKKEKEIKKFIPNMSIHHLKRKCGQDGQKLAESNQPKLAPENQQQSSPIQF